MVRTTTLVLALGIVLFPATAPLAQDAPAGQEPAQTGRTPRVPRSTSSDDAESSAPASPAPAAGEHGSTPPAPSGVARSRVRSHIGTDQRAIALTLDDGYRPDHRILDLIAHYRVHGTAFIVGQFADADPMFLRELVRLGWLVCSHTQSHQQLTSLDDPALRQEMVEGIESVERVVGYRCPYFRAPYGSVDARVAAAADAFGLELIGWDASISDSAPRGTDPALQTRIAIDAIRPGSILLGHFGGTNSYTVLRAVFEWLRTSGYRVGSVTELIDGNARDLETAPDRPDTEPHPAVRTVGSVLHPVAGATRRAVPGPSSTELVFDATGMSFLLALAWRRRLPRRRASRAALTLDPM